MLFQKILFHLTTMMTLATFTINYTGLLLNWCRVDLVTIIHIRKATTKILVLYKFIKLVQLS